MNDQFKLSVLDVPPEHKDPLAHVWVERFKDTLAHNKGISVAVDNGSEHIYLFNAADVGELQIRMFRQYSRTMSRFVTLEEPELAA
jgi:hypothetical protein